VRQGSQGSLILPTVARSNHESLQMTVKKHGLQLETLRELKSWLF
jgi:hypothetical protein